MKDPWFQAQYGTETLCLVHAGTSVGLIVNSMPIECYNYSNLEICYFSELSSIHIDAIIIPSTGALVKILELRPMFEQQIVMRHRMAIRLGASLNLPFLYASKRCQGCSFNNRIVSVVDIPEAMKKHKHKLYM